MPNRPLQASVGQKCSKIWQVKVCLILTNFIMLSIAGIAHAMALGLGPWMAVEIPDLIEKVLVNRLYKVSHAYNMSSIPDKVNDNTHNIINPFI